MLPSGIFNVRPEQDMAILRTKTQWYLLFLGLVFMFTLPLFLSNYWLSQVILLCISVVAVLGLHILTGLCGLFSIGQAAFMAVGAYTAALFASRLGLSGWLTLPLAGIMAGLVGVVFGAPSVRIKGFYLAMATLAAQFIIIWCLDNIESLGYDYENKVWGLGLEPLKLGGVNFSDYGSFYILVAVVMIIMTFFAKNLQRTKTGRVFIAIRDNDLAAQVMGINLFRYKLLAFFIGCFYAGIAGWLFAYHRLYISTADFQLTESIWYVGMLVIGGMGSTAGAPLGTGGVTFLEVITDHYLAGYISREIPEMARLFSAVSLMLFAVVVILFMIFEPRGLYHRWEVFKSTYRLYPYSY